MNFRSYFNEWQEHILVSDDQMGRFLSPTNFTKDGNPERPRPGKNAL